jgi:tetratricopeptide (TPR) repeat protein
MFDESERIINELIDRDPYSNMYWNRLASSQFLRNNIRDSITSSEYSLAINPKDEEALLNKANGLFSLGNYEEAKNYYERFLKIQPNHGGVLQEMAFLESRLGHPELAMEYIDKAEENGIDKELATVTRGYIQLENDNPEETESYFRKALIDSHSSPKVIYYIAIAIYDVGYLPVAKKLLGMLLKDASPQWKDGYAYYARCCFELDSMREYLLALKTAVMKNPDEARAILGDLYPEGTNPEDYLSMPPVPPESDENIPH